MVFFLLEGTNFAKFFSSASEVHQSVLLLMRKDQFCSIWNWSEMFQLGRAGIPCNVTVVHIKKMESDFLGQRSCVISNMARILNHSSFKIILVSSVAIM